MNYGMSAHEPLVNFPHRRVCRGSLWLANSVAVHNGEGGYEMKYLGDEYRLDELVAEVGRFVIYLLLASGWIYFVLCLALEYGG